MRYLFTLLVALAVLSCSTDSAQKEREIQAALKAKYLKEHNVLGSALQPEGYYFVPMTEGEGKTPELDFYKLSNVEIQSYMLQADPFYYTDKVWFYYTFRTLKGELIASNELEGRFEPAVAPYGEYLIRREYYLCKALHYAFKKMKGGRVIMKENGKPSNKMTPGSRARLIIPNNLCTGYPNVIDLTNSDHMTVICDVELVYVKEVQDPNTESRE